MGEHLNAPADTQVPGSCWPVLARIGAGDGNRTHVSSLGSYSSTIELRPPGPLILFGLAAPRQTLPRRRGSPQAFQLQAKMLHDLVEIAADVIELADRDDRLKSCLQRLQRVAAVVARLRNVIRYRRASREHDIVRDLEVASDDRITPCHEAP